MNGLGAAGGMRTLDRTVATKRASGNGIDACHLPDIGHPLLKLSWQPLQTQMRRSLQILMIFVVMCTSSSHLAVLQVVAWTGMFVENVQGGDLEEAISRTFDGDHPCSLCDAITDAVADGGSEGSEGVPLPTVQILDLKLLPLNRVTLLPPAPVRIGIEKACQVFASRAFAPAVPPPRVA